ncbi:hypothetical protein [Acidithrix ferrooxidans]|uniref:DUF4145 domain-containing protein n=1 Tax=Acidithrix ferrooxidans TaxID=1280514 RepID=A0A0D8HGR9_9ACTN|nr:hypothetical protein [Acidithrix ferrooxidans]KJF16957.1 hypothetical protein AXFE_21590 [Acidithrix ferrooxidans]
MSTKRELHIGNQLDPATLDSLADFICGDDETRFPVYRTSSNLTRFFTSVNINAVHDGSTRKWWTLGILTQLTPLELEKIILRIVDLREYKGNKEQLGLAVRTMNDILVMDNLGINFVSSRPVLTDATPINIDISDLTKVPIATDESSFLKQQFSDVIDLGELKLDAVITGFLQARVDEVQACPRDKVPLGTIFLLGSTLEGILIAVATKNLPSFMTAKAAPKDKSGTILKVYDWKLSQLIDVAQELDLLKLDVKKFSHELRDFRNYIHPYHQMSYQFSPDQHTADICWQVFKAAFAQLKVNS